MSTSWDCCMLFHTLHKVLPPEPRRHQEQAGGVSPEHLPTKKLDSKRMSTSSSVQTVPRQHLAHTGNDKGEKYHFKVSIVQRTPMTYTRMNSFPLRIQGNCLDISKHHS